MRRFLRKRKASYGEESDGTLTPSLRLVSHQQKGFKIPFAKKKREQQTTEKRTEKMEEENKNSSVKPVPSSIKVTTSSSLLKKQFGK